MTRTTDPTTYEGRVELLFDISPRKFFELRSSLSMLREEVKTNFASGTTLSGVMCVMAGIDLVAKFYTDYDGPGLGKRVKNIYKR